MEFVLDPLELTLTVTHCFVIAVAVLFFILFGYAAGRRVWLGAYRAGAELLGAAALLWLLPPDIIAGYIVAVVSVILTFDAWLSLRCAFFDKFHRKAVVVSKPRVVSHKRTHPGRHQGDRRYDVDPQS